MRRGACAVAALLMAAALAQIFCQRARPTRGPGGQLGALAGRTETAPVTLHDPRAPAARFFGSIFSTGAPETAWQGTYIDADQFTGRLESDRFRIAGPTLYLPIIGYPAISGNELSLVVRGPQGSTTTILYSGSNPGETGALWSVDTKDWMGGEGYLIVDDQTRGFHGWFGIGQPQFHEPDGPAWLLGIPRNYFTFAVASVAILSLLLLPGLAWRTWLPGRLPDAAPYLPMPGLLLLTGTGLCIWLGGATHLKPFAEAWLAGSTVIAGLLGLHWWRKGGPLSGAETGDLCAWGSVVCGALAFGVLPLAVEQEYDPHSPGQSRMIASPPDASTAYRTADFFLHGKSGRSESSAYFGEAWSVASRGPLVPWLLVSIDALFGITPADPPGLVLDRWPAASDGYYLARITGILTNALAVLGGIALARRLGGAQGGLIAAGWLCAAPVVAINVDFLWPKLLSACFICLAADVILGRGRLLWAVVWSVLAYFSHPVAGLFLPALFLLLFLPKDKNAPKKASGQWPPWIRGVTYLLGCLAGLLPWLLYKGWLGRTDPFLQYPFGDGRGTAAALSFGSWALCRWHNLVLTVVPGAFFLSDHLHSWLRGPVPEGARWAVGYAKSLSGAVGCGAFCGAVAVVSRRSPPGRRRLREVLLLFPLGAMLVYWGYSDDGLGRNCLEPLSLLLIVYAAAAWPQPWLGWRWLILAAALESLSVRWLGLSSTPGFRFAEGGTESALLFAMVLVASLLPPALFLARAAPTRVGL